MLRDYLREARESGRAIYRAARARLDVAMQGESPVAASCQIPDLRAKYAELGLPARDGVFVEVGAFDGESYSNTSFLADQGWRGVYVEPIPRYFRRMKLRHAFNNVKGENVGIGDVSGNSEIKVMGPLSTMNEATAEHYEALSWARALTRNATTVKIRMEPLAVVLARNAVPHDLDLMVVDVEGGEEMIIESLLASEWRPRVLIIELCDVHPDFASNTQLTSSHARVRADLLSSGYREHFVHPINTIFASRG